MADPRIQKLLAGLVRGPGFTGSGGLEGDPRIQGLGDRNALYAPQDTPRAELSATPDPFATAGYYDTPEYRSAKGAAEPVAALIHGEGEQIGRAGSAVKDAYNDPSLANLTNAGVQSAMAVPTARGVQTAAGVAGLGVGIGASRDLGLSPVGEASAKSKAKPSVDPDETFPNGYKRSELDQIGKSFGMSVDDMGALKRSQVQNLVLQKGGSALSQTSKDQDATRDRIARAQSGAETMRDQALSKRDDIYQNSEAGKVTDKLGGFAPFLAAAGLGGIARLASGPTGTALQRFGVPALAGTGGALTTNIAPTIYDSNRQIINPEFDAANRYAEALDDADPKKPAAQQKADAFVQQNRMLNPVRDLAQQQALSPAWWGGKAAASIAEGGLGGIAGSEAVGALSRAPARIAEKIGELPGALSKGYNAGFAGSAEEGARRQALKDRTAQLVAAPRRIESGRGQISEADALARDAATGEASSFEPTAVSTGVPNPRGPSSPDLGQSLRPVRAESPFEAPAKLTSQEINPTSGGNQGQLAIAGNKSPIENMRYVDPEYGANGQSQSDIIRNWMTGEHVPAGGSFAATGPDKMNEPVLRRALTDAGVTDPIETAMLRRRAAAFRELAANQKGGQFVDRPTTAGTRELHDLDPARTTLGLTGAAGAGLAASQPGEAEPAPMTPQRLMLMRALLQSQPGA